MDKKAYENLLPMADCPNCLYMHLQHESGHCYMFRDPPGERCGQFTDKDGDPRKGYHPLRGREHLLKFFE